MLEIVKAGDYDVALMGCGGLGLPLAAAAKTAGRIGIHLVGICNSSLAFTVSAIWNRNGMPDGLMMPGFVQALTKFQKRQTR